MNTKHTPGPWRTLSHDTLHNVRHIDAGPKGYERITVAILDGKQSEANARLIASAPELLEAFQELVAINEEHNHHLDKIMGKPPEWKDAYLNKARSAISKATGKDTP